MRKNVDTNNGRTLRWHHEVVNFIYNIQVMRISKGYSQKELSFLLGLPGNRVATIEGFIHNKEYSIIDISLLAKIFECTVKELFNPCHFPTEWLEMKVYREHLGGGRVIYNAYALKENGKADLLYSLTEKPLRMRSVKQIISSVKKCINSFITSGYFKDGVDVAEIFKDAKRAINEDFRPIHLAQVLRSYIVSDSGLGLKRACEEDHYYYVEAPAI